MRYKCLIVTMLVFSVHSFGFEACQHYFSGNFKGSKNLRLSMMMQALQEDIWEIQSFLRMAKSDSYIEQDFHKAAIHVTRFLRIAQSMHEKHNSELAPGRTLEIPAERHSAYLKMYSEFTNQFFQLATQLNEAFMKGDWKQVDSLMMSIDTLTALAHMRVESNKY